MMGLQDIEKTLALERWLAGEQVIEGAAKVVNVGANVGAGGIGDLFRSHVIRRAQRLAGPG